MTRKSAYLANVLAFDVTGGRVKQYMRKDPKGEDHCVKCQDSIFVAVLVGEAEAATTVRCHGRCEFSCGQSMTDCSMRFPASKCHRESCPRHKDVRQTHQGRIPTPG